MLRWAEQQEARDPEWRQQYRTDARRPLGEKEVYGGRTTMNNNNEQQWTTMNNNEQQWTTVKYRTNGVTKRMSY